MWHLVLNLHFCLKKLGFSAKDFTTYTRLQVLLSTGLSSYFVEFEINSNSNKFEKLEKLKNNFDSNNRCQIRTRFTMRFWGYNFSSFELLDPRLRSITYSWNYCIPFWWQMHFLVQISIYSLIYASAFRAAKTCGKL